MDYKGTRNREGVQSHKAHQPGLAKVKSVVLLVFEKEHRSAVAERYNICMQSLNCHNHNAVDD